VTGLDFVRRDVLLWGARFADESCCIVPNVQAVVASWLGSQVSIKTADVSKGPSSGAHEPTMVITVLL